MVESSLGDDLMLVCNISYPTAQDLTASAPTLAWSEVDLSAQSSQVVGGVFFESVLDISSVNSSYCGYYTCAAVDDRIAAPFTGTASVQVGKHVTVF